MNESETPIVRDLSYWEQKKSALRENGYVVFESILSQALCQQSIDAICDFMEVKQFDSSTWYKENPLNGTGSVPMHHHPAFWQVRQDPDVYRAFCEMLEEKELWVTMDRASFKPPCRYDLEQYGDDQNPLHWDYDFRKVDGEVYQGLVYLTDTESEQGAFACVPSLYREIVEDRFENSQGFSQFQINGLFLHDVYDCQESEIVKVAAPAGSLIIFDSRLPHGNVATHHNKPRFVQFISMFKANSRYGVPDVLFQQQADRVECYLKSLPPSWLTGWNGQLAQEPFAPQPLTELGRRLVGLESW
ncbi:phytanoyl-CoA dioxygenase family protein [Aliikangiella coralliicola]|uniref:Phytanoyl-CoA dioxygenase family protein n=1 Tax=Aliikangiella coralliicola TaxID=2592383 RepID=A0A545UCY6_9GAMM|nr:phytanoyl-CoA dioxygenase family protein [Aliikangiella coralliicola]TQV87325.1 phytanoyl-CoA dioxygenase family protein [Aliikangiella coralliicola]